MSSDMVVGVGTCVLVIVCGVICLAIKQHQTEAAYQLLMLEFKMMDRQGSAVLPARWRAAWDNACEVDAAYRFYHFGKDPSTPSRFEALSCAMYHDIRSSWKDIPSYPPGTQPWHQKS